MSQDSAGKSTYDLEERTAKFGENIIGFVKTLRKDPIIHDDIGLMQFVIPGLNRNPVPFWIPAFAGMTRFVVINDAVYNNQLIGQIVRSGTSLGANYMEADGAESKKDFRHKIAFCKKEAKETKHWLRMIKKANPDRKTECDILWNEAQELTLIFSSILLKV
jgi:four helix bundle protein